MSNKEQIHCEHCDRELSEDEIYERDGLVLCIGCFNEEEDLNGILFI